MCAIRAEGLGFESRLDLVSDPTIENGKELCIRVLYFFSVLHALSGLRNNHQTGLNLLI